MNSDLSLFTSEELIQELFGRKLFAGVIVYSPEENKFEGHIHQQVKVFATPDNETTIKMLEVGIAAVEELNGERKKQ